MRFLIAFILLCTALLVLAQPAAADSFIWIDVSVKVIVDPATGQVPPEMDDTLLRDSFIDMNRWLANTWRGYRLRLVDLDGSQNFKRIGGYHDTTGPGKYYTADLKYNATLNHQLETDAKADKPLYGWNDYAINLYFNAGTFSSAQFPWSGWDLVQSAYALLVFEAPSGGFADRYKVAGNLLHEFGHWFGLCHTFENSPCGVWGDTLLDPNTLTPPDTRDDALVLDTIAQFNYDGSSYASLSAYDQWLVSNTANNAMSYYQLFYDEPSLGKVLTDAERFGPTRFIFTELQMDAWADWANTGRGLAVTSGRTWFVKPGTGPGGDGSSANEFQLISQAEAAASDAGGDILLLRQGVYGGPLLITKPLTLRATCQGSAVIGQ